MSTSEIFKKIKTYLITGALVMVPLFITFYIIAAIIKLIGRHAGFGHGILSDILGICTALALVILTGFLTQHAIGSRVVGWLGLILKRIPIAGGLYSAVKQIFEAIMMSKSKAFQKAVLIEYPREGIYSVAFVTKEAHRSSFTSEQENMVHLFLPTTPNPTSGYFLIVPEKNTKPLGLSVEDSFKLIISGGIVSFNENNLKAGGSIK